MKILYNSDLTFSERIYGSLDVDLTRVKLHEPLNMIVQQPLLFVRDLVPKSCFTALTRMDEVRLIQLHIFFIESYLLNHVLHCYR